MIRRYASNYLLIEGKFLRQQVIEIKNGEVVNYFPLFNEIESVEWLPGLIEIIIDDNHRMAYHQYPYDFVNKQPVDETQRRQLL